MVYVLSGVFYGLDGFGASASAQRRWRWIGFMAHFCAHQPELSFAAVAVASGHGTSAHRGNGITLVGPVFPLRPVRLREQRLGHAASPAGRAPSSASRNVGCLAARILLGPTGRAAGPGRWRTPRSRSQNARRRPKQAGYFRVWTHGPLARMVRECYEYCRRHYYAHLRGAWIGLTSVS
jgi:hypothetical protein